MMDCLEFRRRVGAEPAARDPEIDAHRAACPACARYHDELRAMDGLIRRALTIDPSRAAGTSSATPEPPVAARRRIFAIAASLVAGIAVGLVLLVVAPRASIAREVMGHVLRETSTLEATAPVSADALAGVLDPEGVRLRPGVGDVTFAARCVFDGRVVPHLVVRMPEGPVTVLMLRHRTVPKPIRIDEQGYKAVVLPAPRGSIAVVGQGALDLDAVAGKVYGAVEWGD